MALLTYHYRRTELHFWSGRDHARPKRTQRLWVHVDAMHNLGTELRRFDIHGFGEPDNWEGLLIQEPSRIVVQEHLLTVESEYYGQLHDAGIDALFRLAALAALPRAEVDRRSTHVASASPGRTSCCSGWPSPATAEERMAQ